jgi:hypothetical protein
VVQRDVDKIVFRATPTSADVIAARIAGYVHKYCRGPAYTSRYQGTYDLGYHVCQEYVPVQEQAGMATALEMMATRDDLTVRVVRPGMHIVMLRQVS